MITLLTFAISGSSWATDLAETCIISAFNRTAPVQSDGSWVLPNVPATLGPVRVRATCVREGQTLSGQSNLVSVPVDDVVFVPEILFDQPTPIPRRLALSAPATSLGALGESLQLTVSGLFDDGSQTDLTAEASGTTYSTSSPAAVRLDGDGRVTAVGPGVALISAVHEGAIGVLRLQVVTSGDSDADGMPDDFEIANGLDPNNPADAFADLDADALTNLTEFQRGTSPRNPDTDADTLLDGEEGAYGTHPLLFDTDGDGLSDGLEIRTGSDPLDPASYNLAAALATFTVSPASFDLVYNTLLGEASAQLTVTGELIDGTALDLTSTARGTSYSSSDLTACSFGIEPGRIFAGGNGACTITVANSGFTSEVAGTVRVFSPTALGFVALPGFAHDVEIAGDLAYVAAGAAGVVVVDVSERSAPIVVATFDTPGTCQALRIDGSLAFVADGTSLLVLDLADPLAPVLLGTLALTGDVQALALRAGTAYVAAGTAGFHVVDVRDPGAPLLLATIDTPGTARGVDVAGAAEILLIADGAGGLRLYDLSDPAYPLLSSLATGDARSVAARGNAAFVADRVSSLVSVDFTNPAAPVRGAVVPRETGGLLEDVALSGSFAFGADVFFVNGVPILDITTPGQPSPRAILDFSAFRDDDGTGIAVDDLYVYLTAQRAGSSRLYVGQYLLDPDRDDVTLSGNQVLDSRYTGQSLVLAAGTFTAVEPLVLQNLTVLAGARLTAPLDTPLSLTVADALRVQTGGSLDVSGLGWRGGYAGHPEGYAPAGVRPSSPDAGGSHGGVGTTWDGPGLAGEPFGDVYLPGAAGGGGAQDEDGVGDGTRGGGVLSLEVGTLALDGEIRARGETSEANSSRPAGAGGSVQIHAGTMHGTGLIDVSGSSTSTVFNFERFPGPGGGGRVALWVASFEGFDPAAQVRAWGGRRGGTSVWAGPGTVFVREAGELYGRLIVDNGTGRGAGTTPLPALGDGGGYRFDRLELRNGARLDATDPVWATMIEVSGDARLPTDLSGVDMVVRSGAVARPARAEPWLLRLTGTLMVEPGAVLDVSGQGYLGGRAGHPDGDVPEGLRGSSPDAGGSHGGLGTTWDGPGPAGEVFGSVYMPSQAGGGGSQDEDGTGDGTRGGGVLVLEVGTLALDGEIRARGESSEANSSRPAGAGGSVQIHAGTMHGTGLIDVSGSSTSTVFNFERFPGPGAGGRVALWVDSFDGFDPAAQVRAWGGRRGTSNVYAGPGTVYVREAGEPYGRLIIDNGAGRSAGPTPLPALGTWPILETEDEGDDLWVSTSPPFLPRWLGAWAVLRDGAGGVLGSYRMGEIDALGRVQLLGAGGVVGAVEIAGAYRFEAVLTPNGTVVMASDPVVVGD